MTTIITDARTLYDVSSDFRAFLSIWETEKRCPLPLVDFLIEHGLEVQAEACRWAATEPDRPYYIRETNTKTGPYPNRNGSRRYWCRLDTDSKIYHNNEIPNQHLSQLTERAELPDFPDVTSALVGLLDNWKV